MSNWFAATNSRFDCERCGNVMDMQPTAASAQFRGGGWAKDGYTKTGETT